MFSLKMYSHILRETIKYVLFYFILKITLCYACFPRRNCRFTAERPEPLSAASEPLRPAVSGSVGRCQAQPPRESGPRPWQPATVDRCTALVIDGDLESHTASYMSKNVQPISAPLLAFLSLSV